MIHSVATPAETWLAGALESVREELQARLLVLPGLDPLSSARQLPAGKLLRPRLLLCVAAAAGGTGSVTRKVTSLAAVVELIHLATLYHDDVLDGSPHRRRVASVRQRLGNKISILFGDALLAAAVETMLRRSNRRTLTTIARAVTTTLHGEMEQHLRHRRVDLAEADCIRIARLKTGSLFALAGRLGAMMGGASAGVVQEAARMGRRLGTAFQLIDDALDYAGSAEVLGKEPGADYREGIATLPLVNAWLGAAPNDRHVIEKGLGRHGAGSFPAVRALVTHPECFSITLGAARLYVDRARRSLAELEKVVHVQPLIAAYIRDIERRIPELSDERRLRESAG